MKEVSKLSYATGLFPTTYNLKKQEDLAKLDLLEKSDRDEIIHRWLQNYTDQEMRDTIHLLANGRLRDLPSPLLAETVEAYVMRLEGKRLFRALASGEWQHYKPRKITQDIYLKCLLQDKTDDEKSWVVEHLGIGVFTKISTKCLEPQLLLSDCFSPQIKAMWKKEGEESSVLRAEPGVTDYDEIVAAYTKAMERWKTLSPQVFNAAQALLDDMNRDERNDNMFSRNHILNKTTDLLSDKKLTPEKINDYRDWVGSVSSKRTQALVYGIAAALMVLAVATIVAACVFIPVLPIAVPLAAKITAMSAILLFGMGLYTLSTAQELRLFKSRKVMNGLEKMDNVAVAIGKSMKMGEQAPDESAEDERVPPSPV